MLCVLIKSWSIVIQESLSVIIHASRISDTMHDGVNWDSWLYHLAWNADGVVGDVVLMRVPGHWSRHISVIDETSMVHFGICNILHVFALLSLLYSFLISLELLFSFNHKLFFMMFWHSWFKSILWSLLCCRFSSIRPPFAHSCSCSMFIVVSLNWLHQRIRYSILFCNWYLIFFLFCLLFLKSS